VNSRSTEVPKEYTEMTPPVNSRFSHHFGEASPRLDKSQSIMVTDPTTDHWVYRLCDLLCFGLPEVQHSRFNAIFVDHQVDVNDFRAMLSDCIEDWKSSLSSVSASHCPRSIYAKYKPR
jgi:hypothetical protein